MQLTHPNAVILSGASLTGALDLTECALISIYMPAAWTAAVITLAACDTADGTFLPVYDASGTELSITTSTSRIVAIAPDATRGLAFVKLRSGTVGAAVAQGADRTLKVAVIPLGGV